MRPSQPLLPRFLSPSRRLRGTNLKGFDSLLRYSICIIGFFIATFSLYSTLNLHGEKNLGNGRLNGDSELPKVTIFSAPRPLISSNGSDLTWARQKLAVRSWLALSDNVDVVLFGRHPSIVELKEGYSSRVTIEPSIDFTFLGTPFFHSMVARAQSTASDISMLIDSETVLFPEIFNAITSIQKLDKDWFVFSFTPNILNFAYQLAGSGHSWFGQDGRMIESNKLQEALFKQSEVRNCSERLLIVWNNLKLPLFHGVMPPFMYGKGFYELWLINEILSSEIRTVFDASNLNLSLYPENLGTLSSMFSEDYSTWSKRTWEYHTNLRVAQSYGLLFFQKTFLSNAPYEIVNSLGQYYFLNEEKGHILAPGTNRKKEILNSLGCHKERNKCSLWQFDNLTLGMPAQIEYKYTLERILQTVSDENKTVILGISGESYRDMLMSWVCRLRNLGITNFIVYALDPETYEFSLLQGLPVFMDTKSPKNISFDDCHFGTECFQRVTKVKSRMVLKILKLGYNVLLSDIDVYWFQNPLPYLSSFGPGVLGAQSDEYNETLPINLPRRLNSGFYFAQSDPITIAAIELVVKHASSSNLSEQPSFYDTLCGEGGANRVGDNRCVERRTNLTVVLLDRDLFPNGAYKGIWEKRDIRSVCANLGCFVLHNNWISGRKRKLERQMASGLWDYDPTLRMCIQNWSNFEVLSDHSY
ncbi:Nucleotide-diphospho-sugar transferase family protein [Rhynchospora pubera]|uniref:Nucleotide-diphospho-sugar transferase family protein n=1 Tax=Rhynchospora pubera TaxID=906938 RepID=A0AAV8F9K6_9POAL|nr:Nucleotide-diphospho-sugar transferase family protein [Rhynchospora pubera]